MRGIEEQKRNWLLDTVVMTQNNPSRYLCLLFIVPERRMQDLFM